MLNRFVSGFQVISAQQLPKPEHDKPTSIVDPQVWVEVHGVPIDNNKKKTHYVNNNGETLWPARPLLCSVVCMLEEAAAEISGLTRLALEKKSTDSTPLLPLLPSPSLHFALL